MQIARNLGAFKGRVGQVAPEEFRLWDKQLPTSMVEGQMSHADVGTSSLSSSLVLFLLLDATPPSPPLPPLIIYEKEKESLSFF